MQSSHAEVPPGGLDYHSHAPDHTNEDDQDDDHKDDHDDDHEDDHEDDHASDLNPVSTKRLLPGFVPKKFGETFYVPPTYKNININFPPSVYRKVNLG